MHTDIDELPDRIVHTHFGKPAVARFLIRFTLGAGRLSSRQRRFHVFNLKSEVIDSLTPTPRRQHRHVDVTVREIDRAVTVISHRTAPRFSHAEGFLVELRGLFLIFDLDRNMPDSCHVVSLLYDLYSRRRENRHTLAKIVKSNGLPSSRRLLVFASFCSLIIYRTFTKIPRRISS